MASGLNEHEISAALLEKSDCDIDETFLPGSEDKEDHLSCQSEHESEEEVEENISDGESSSSQPFYMGKDGKTRWLKKPLRNAMVIQMLNNDIEIGKTNHRRIFIRNLGMALIEEHLKNRKDNPWTPRDSRKRLHELLGETPPEPPVKMPRSKTRCSERDRKKDRKTKYSCERCDIPICLEHAHLYCKNCTEFNQPGSHED